MNKEIPSVEQIADVFKKIMNKKMICGQSIRNNWEDRETETIDWIELLPVVELVEQYHSEENQAITQHTAELQRELEESKDAYFGAKKANMMREAALKTELWAAKEQLTEAQSQIAEQGKQIVALREALSFFGKPDDWEDYYESDTGYGYFRLLKREQLPYGMPSDFVAEALTSTKEAGERIKREWLEYFEHRLMQEVGNWSFRDSWGVEAIYVSTLKEKALQALKEGGV